MGELADTLPVAAPEDVGMSSARLERLSQAMQGYIDRQEMAGAATLIARRGKIVHVGSFGMANIARAEPTDPSTLYRIASMTKPITSVAVMMLFEEGRVHLNDPIENYLPELGDVQVIARDDSPDGYHVEPARNPVTVRHLLTHSSGYTYGDPEPLGECHRKAGIPAGFENTDDTIGAAVKRLGAVPLLFHPGEGWAYGVSTDVLGRLVEVVSGSSLDAFFEARILAPLGMSDTHFFLPAEKVARLASVYTRRDSGALEHVESDYPYKGPGTLFMGGAGLCSTITDYARFLQMMLNGGHLGDARLLSRRTVDLVRENHVGDLHAAERPGYGFGLGFAVHADAGRSSDILPVGSYLWGGYWHTTFWIDPVEELIAIKMSQVFPADHLDDHQALQPLVYGAIDD
ncbi:beta-lactamase family protein [Candidatus Poribacteria bacterium]|nr:beta-lactamase family protein [Candidatus Poribacteria bacterium]